MSTNWTQSIFELENLGSIIEEVFNNAVDRDEILIENGKMNWDWVSADVWMDLFKDFELILMTSPQRKFIQDSIDDLIDAWEEARWDHTLESTEPIESFPW